MSTPTPPGALAPLALIAQFEALKAELTAEIAPLTTEQEIRGAQARYLGKKGRVSELMKLLGRLPAADRGPVGAKANEAKTAIEAAVEARLGALADVALAADLARTVDVTLPGRGERLGTLHPLTLVHREIAEIFRGLGFEIRSGPWIETEWNNFDALNTPADHPARDMQDTFFVEGGLILRSHTSPVQVRTMLAGPPPVKIIAPGMVFRRDDDATHTPMFDQVEGLYVDENVSFEDLKATLFSFVQQFFGPRTRIRLRPSFFPFTEPSAEMDVECRLCGGVGCPACKGTGWMEILGSGMVHPRVLESAGVDPERYSGWAFGMGPGRIALQRYGIPDIRILYDSDVRFLEQIAR
jgi:phenylalanyl-tRNA synthetase alpha chain